jgi:ribosomal-protein-alanine N-acetyltransferase
MDISPISMMDAAVLAQIHGECFQDAWNEESFKALLFKDSFFGFLLKFQQKPIGFVLCNSPADEIELITLCVLTDFRNKGCGRYLLENVMTHAEQRASKKIFLEVSKNNTKGISLYESLGFQKIGIRKEYYQNFAKAGDRNDALVMVYLIPQS